MTIGIVKKFNTQKEYINKTTIKLI